MRKQTNLVIFLISILILLHVDHSHAIPQISAVTQLTGDFKITIQGKSFSQKPNPKPLMYWHADLGLVPSSDFGRKSKWDSTFSGALVNSSTPGVSLAKGSKNSLRLDQGTSEGAILARVEFNSSQLYVWRRRFDAFSLIKDRAIRTRYLDAKAINGRVSNVVSNGMWMSSMDKSIWAKVNYVSSGVAFYSSTLGNINQDETQTKKIIQNGTPILFYDELDSSLSTPLINATVNEGDGVYFTFNHKVIRFWVEYGVEPIDLYLSLDKNGMAYVENSGDSPYFRSGWMNKIQPAEFRWVHEEFQYQSNNVNEIDGIFHFWQDNLRAWNESKRFRFRTTARPNPFKQLYQAQVSNGAQVNSFEYFDSLYVDDTWHRVLIGNSSTYSNCTKLELVIPSSWNDSSIEGTIRLGEFSGISLDQLYLYIFDVNGQYNENGFRIVSDEKPINPIPPVIQSPKIAVNSTNRVSYSTINCVNWLMVILSICLIMFSM